MADGDASEEGFPYVFEISSPPPQDAEAPAEPEAEPVDEAPSGSRFIEHYEGWRALRLRTIIEHYTAMSLRGARVLELGCGYGDIGMALFTLGADVTFAEGRQEHLDVMAARYPFLQRDRLVRYDAEDPWPFEPEYDLVLNLGLVYHVDNWERSIEGSLASAPHVVLETEVCDSDDPDLVIKTVEEGYDQALSGVGSRPSGAAVERLIRSNGARSERLIDNRCNSGFHRYDWPITNSGGWEHGQRRFWFCWQT